MTSSSVVGRKKRLPLPPGPPRLPLLGNWHQFPPKHPWKQYMAWAREYNSDIIHVDIFGQPIIVLCSTKATDDLLEKRSSIYSDRPDFTMTVDLMRWDFNIAFMKYGDRWRANRRLFNKSFTANASLAHRPLQISATRRVLKRLLDTPENFADHFRHWTGITTMEIAYGIHVQEEGIDPYVKLSQDAVHLMSTAGVPGRYLVDSLPFLKHVPSWLPGSFGRFKRDAKLWSPFADRMGSVPLDYVKERVDEGIAEPCFAADAYARLKAARAAGEELFFDEDTIRGAAGTLYIGGADTSLSAFNTFVLAMLANPAAQRRAQAEIDSVLGGTTLPNYDHMDAQDLPYVDAVVKETLRWKNVTPAALPHFTRVEDEYRGYRIPANSIVIGNAWAILHDEKIYPDPYEFKPERWLLPDGTPNSTVPDPASAFGFGRRLCPGRHMAQASVWIIVASVLATFNITKARDESEKEIEPTYEFDLGFINSPIPFKAKFTPRSQEAIQLILGGHEDVGV
uniref:Cytochrome P450 n=1 Tax=Mycena chlorophos TaxID=658473 RepID=A0ABQ0LK40_MYCCL|nr:cytochrome P450 [Mycena chlorophos]